MKKEPRPQINHVHSVHSEQGKQFFILKLRLFFDELYGEIPAAENSDNS